MNERRDPPTLTENRTEMTVNGQVLGWIAEARRKDVIEMRGAPSSVIIQMLDRWKIIAELPSAQE